MVRRDQNEVVELKRMVSKLSDAVIVLINRVEMLEKQLSHRRGSSVDIVDEMVRL